MFKNKFFFEQINWQGIATAYQTENQKLQSIDIAATVAKQESSSRQITSIMPNASKQQKSGKSKVSDTDIWHQKCIINTNR